MAEQALGGIRERVLRAILKLPSPRLGAQGFAGGAGPAWQVTAQCGQGLAGENGLTLLSQSQPGFSWSGQVREDEASEAGGGVEAAEGEGSERGLGKTLEVMDTDGPAKEAAQPGARKPPKAAFASAVCMPPAQPNVWFS